MSECIFCEIVAERSPAKFRARGISSVAIEPLNPVTPGHLLVIPRKHVTDALDDPGVTATTMYDAAVWAKLFDPSGAMNIITSVGSAATQSVFHLHVHLVPRAEGDGLILPWSSMAQHDAEVLEAAADEWHAENSGTAPRPYVWLNDRAQKRREEAS